MQHESQAPDSRVASGPGELLFLAVIGVLIAVLFPEALELQGVFHRVYGGPGSLAQIMLIAMSLLTIFLALPAARKGQHGLAQTIKYLFSRDAVMLLVTVTIYALVVDLIGFIIATFAFLLATMYLLDKSKLPQKAILCAATVGTVWLLFSFLFEVVLP